MRNRRRAFFCILFHLSFMLLLNTGCSEALKRSVIRATTNGDYAKALKKLERAGVGTIISTDASKDDIKARVAYQTIVENRYLPKIKRALSSGKARDSLRIAHEGLGLCSWSAPLAIAAYKGEAIITAIDTHTSNARKALDEGASAETLRSLLVEARSLQKLLVDSPAATKAIADSEVALLDYWAREISSYIRSSSDEWGKQFETDLSLVTLSYNTKTQLLQEARLLHSLPGLGNNTLNYDHDIDFHGLKAYAEQLSTPSSNAAKPIRDQFAEVLRDWSSESLAELLRLPNADFALVDLAETLKSYDLFSNSERSTRALSSAHMNCAIRRSTNGKASLIALVHLNRLTKLSPEFDRHRIEEISNTVTATFAATESFRPRIAIDVSVNVHPIVNEWVRMAVQGAIESKTFGHCDWQWVDSIQDVPEVIIRLDEAELLVYSPSDLDTVSSQYLSHYENVPNPEKSRLENMLNVAKMDIAYKENTYSLAVSSHNSYPTEWSLANVNSAYSNYQMSVNNHNMIVMLYNAAPATISQPVYLPYGFYQGTIKQGWRIRGHATVGDESTHLDAENIDRDFVRLGGKYNDVNAEYRRDDQIDIDTSTNRLIEQLVDVSSQIASRLRSSLNNLNIVERMELPKSETTLLAWMMNPFGLDTIGGEDLGISSWAIEAAASMKFPEMSSTPPERRITRLNVGKNHVKNMSTMDIVQKHQKHICEIISGIRGTTSLGSGSLISPDGLILTCAHVIHSEDLKIRFKVGPLTGEYTGSAVFINEAADVALVRAERINSPTWMDIQLGELPKTGERVVSLGNPTLPDGSTVEGAVSEGVVSSPLTEYWGQPRIVADVTVASGSSGGPLISVDTGEIVGVVVAVAKADISDKHSSSGYFCLVAPSELFHEWLGLKYYRD